MVSVKNTTLNFVTKIVGRFCGKPIKSRHQNCKNQTFSLNRKMKFSAKMKTMFFHQNRKIRYIFLSKLQIRLFVKTTKSIFFFVKIAKSVFLHQNFKIEFPPKLKITFSAKIKNLVSYQNYKIPIFAKIVK